MSEVDALYDEARKRFAEYPWMMRYIDALQQIEADPEWKGAGLMEFLHFESSLAAELQDRYFKRLQCTPLCLIGDKHSIIGAGRGTIIQRLLDEYGSKPLEEQFDVMELCSLRITVCITTLVVLGRMQPELQELFADLDRRP